MKIGENKYQCGFCSRIVDIKVRKIKGAGKKGTATSQIRCECGNDISQKTSEEIRR